MHASHESSTCQTQVCRLWAVLGAGHTELEPVQLGELRSALCFTNKEARAGGWELAREGGLSSVTLGRGVEIGLEPWLLSSNWGPSAQSSNSPHAGQPCSWVREQGGECPAEQGDLLAGVSGKRNRVTAF